MCCKTFRLNKTAHLFYTNPMDWLIGLKYKECNQIVPVAEFLVSSVLYFTTMDILKQFRYKIEQLILN